jgi:acyl-CoA reductase-like NAD-dependent aldehyde dehydrogenase
MSGLARIVSPIDGSVVAERPTAGEAEIAAALQRARRARAAWAEVSVEERGAYLLRFLEALAARNSEIVPELAWQMGRPVRFGGERAGVEERCRHMIAIAPAALRTLEPPGGDGIRRRIAREPLGTVLVVAPWNYPYLTAVNSIVPALMAGNAVILKHATQTFLAGDRLARAMAEAGLPAGLFQHLLLSHAATEALLGSGEIDHVNFTGSVEGGRRIEAAAAGTFAGVGLELGGKDPAYVRADADLERAVEGLVEGALFNSGQSCCGVERIYVHADLHDRFVEAFVEAARAWRLGDPLDRETRLGPMAAARVADPVRAQIAEALRMGATAHLRSRHPEDREGSPWLAPEVLTGVDHRMEVMRVESFGPVVGIMPVRDDDEAVRLMNDSPYGLSASLWTADLDAAERLGARLETGTVYANRCDYLDPALVWTGVKDTGRGGTLSEIGYAHLTQPKSYHLRPAGGA